MVVVVVVVVVVVANEAARSQFDYFDFLSLSADALLRINKSVLQFLVCPTTRNCHRRRAAGKDCKYLEKRQICFFVSFLLFFCRFVFSMKLHIVQTIVFPYKGIGWPVNKDTSYFFRIYYFALVLATPPTCPGDTSRRHVLNSSGACAL